MSEREGTQWGPGGKAKEKTRGVEGRGRARARSVPRPVRPAPQLPGPTPTSGASGAPKRVCRSLFRRPAAEQAPTERVAAGVGPGTGRGAAASQPSPLPVAEKRPTEESAGELSLGLGLGEETLDSALGITPGTKALLQGLGEEASPSVLLPAATSSPSGMVGGEVGSEEGEQEKAMEEEAVEVAPPSASLATPSGSQRSSQEESPGGRAVGRLAPPTGFTSEVWKYFQMTEDVRYAQCQICRVRVSRGKDMRHLTVTGMRNHLKRNHSLIALGGGRAASAGGAKRPAPAASSGEGPSAPSPSQPQRSRAVSRQGHQATLSEMLGGFGATAPTGRAKKQASKRVTRHLAAMIVVGELPYSFVELAPLRDLLQEVVPWYTPPSRTTMSRRVLPSLFKATRDRVKECLSRVRGRGVHFTSDLWTSPHSQNAFLSLTAQWWETSEALGEGGGTSSAREGTRQPGYRRALLGAEILSERHTAENISEAIGRLLDQWVERDSRGFLVTDGGSNMRLAATKLGMERIPCAAHLLHLVVKDALGLGETVSRDANTLDFQRLLSKCRAIVGHFHRSPRDTHILRGKQTETGVPEHRLIADVSTRWNSTCAMIERLVEQKSALIAFFQRNTAIQVEHQLDHEEWTALAQTVEVLEPFKKHTEALSSDTASLALVVLVAQHATEGLAKFLGPDSERADLLPAVRALVRRLQNGMAARFGDDVIRSEPYMLASMCDPRIKGKIAEASGMLADCRDSLCRRVEQLQEKRGTLPHARQVGQESGTAAVPDQPAPQGAPLVPTASKSWVMELFTLVAGPSSGSSVGPGRESAEAMVKEYLFEPCEPQSTDPLHYWAIKEKVWPDLSLVAQWYLSCPPTSVASERVFSVAGDIVSPHRSRLLPWKVEQLTFLKVNYPLFKHPPLDLEDA